MQGYIGAYVLVDLKGTDFEEVRSRFLEMPGVVLVHALLGPTDLICYIESENLLELQQLLDGQIRSLIDDNLVQRTETRLVLASQGVGFTPDHNNTAKGSAWVFIDVSIGDPDPVIGNLVSIDGVVNAHKVIGACDVIAYLEAEDLEELMKILDGQLRKIPGIGRTDTRLVLMRRARRVRRLSPKS